MFRVRDYVTMLGMILGVYGVTFLPGMPGWHESDFGTSYVPLSPHSESAVYVWQAWTFPLLGMLCLGGAYLPSAWEHRRQRRVARRLAAPSQSLLIS